MKCSRTWLTAPSTKSEKKTLWSWVRIPHASPHDAVLTRKKEGRTRDGQGGKVPQESPGCNHGTQEIQTEALREP